MFSQKVKILFCLLALVIVSFGLRIYKVDTIPSGIHADEASWGYNAYSVLKTGKDEHGVPNPLIFQAFGDQKLPAYIYSLVPSIQIFDLNNFSIRFPAVLIGTFITVAIFFFLIEYGFSLRLSFIGALITATSPWQIIMSRVFGYDSNFGLLFFILGLLFAFKACKKDHWYYILLSSLAFGLTWYSYIAYRLITPLALISFILIYNRNKKFTFLKSTALMIGFIIVITPFIYSSFSGQGVARFNQVASTPSLGIVLTIDENRSFCTQSLPKLLCYANSNKLTSYGWTYLHRYINTLSPDYLFFTGDKEVKFLNVDDFGVFPVFLLFFYFPGFIYLWNQITQRKLTKNELFLLVGFIIAPLPAIMVDTPNKVRISAFLPFLVILILYGVSYVRKLLDKFITSPFYYSFLVGFLLLSCLIFMLNFLAIHVNKNEYSYNTHIPKLMKYLGDQDKKTQIYIHSMDEGIEYYAYVNKTDPQTYQKYVIREKPNEIGFAHATDLENIHIIDQNIYRFYCSKEKDNIRGLFATTEDVQKVVGKAKNIIKSENNAQSRFFIYDLSMINNLSEYCKNY